jgi:alginate O-acetyltransferase complex protein AlgI
MPRSGHDIAHLRLVQSFLSLASPDMVFSSPSFLFLFLPLFLLSYSLVPSAWRNVLIFLGSLFFYATAAPAASLVLLASVVSNHYLAYAIALKVNGVGNSDLRAAKLLLIVGVLGNLLPLIFYKYLGFFTVAVNDFSALIGIPSSMAVPQIELPPGISFFTFQGLSYIVDVYSRVIRPAGNLGDFGMYHTSFPQLIAGPIVRYIEVESKVTTRTFGVDTLYPGLILFCAGLAKKIVIADNLGSIADKVFALPADQLAPSLAWLGTVTYTLQIYFDFSGYSDMAIGLGLMLGFAFPQNFNQPYRAQNVTEFWRRWHMTLSRWFRDYVYIPLGGNQHGQLRTYLNLMAVFVLCGLWHGAAYTFVVWGLYYGILLVMERIARERFGLVPKGALGWGLTMLLVMIGWVLFRSDTIGHAMLHLKAMAGIAAVPSPIYSAAFYLTPDKIVFLFVGIFVAVVPFERLAGPISTIRQIPGLIEAAALGMFVYSCSVIATNGFNPFIYFRF